MFNNYNIKYNNYKKHYNKEKSMKINYNKKY